MPVIEPVSELRNYGRILEKVDSDSPVYLTKNGKGAYSIHSIDDDEEFEKAFGRKADKRRKLYNGMIKCQYYMYFK